MSSWYGAARLPPLKGGARSATRSVETPGGARHWLGSSLSSEPRGLAGLSISVPWHAGVLTPGLRGLRSAGASYAG